MGRTPSSVAGQPRYGLGEPISTYAIRVEGHPIRSLVISYKLLATREWLVIHHTNCGMDLFTTDIMRGLLASSLEPDSLSTM